MKNKKLLLFILIPVCLIALVIGLVLLLPDTDADKGEHSHAFSEWTVARPASCAAAGEEIRSCGCGETERKPIEALPHTPVAIAGKDPTPTEEGLTEGEICSACGLIFKEQVSIPRVTAWDGTVAASFAGGSGIESDPYLIEDGTQLALLAQMTNASGDGLAGLHFKLISNVHLGEREWTPIGTNQDHYFGASFDGNGKKIYAFTITDLANDQWYARYAGVFGYANGAIVENLKVTNFVLDVKGENFLMAGGVAGYLINSTLSNCVADGTVYVNDNYTYAGLATGRAENTELSNCSSHGTITSVEYHSYCIVGGLTGMAENCSFTSCTSDANISNLAASVGGLCGLAEKATFLNCSASGEINAVESVEGGHVCAGGIIGEASEITVERCFATVSVTARGSHNVRAGGLIGQADSGDILSCYATGNITIEDGMGRLCAGGLIGDSRSEMCVRDCSATGEVHIKPSNAYASAAGGLIGESSGKVIRCYATGNVLAENDNTTDYPFVYAGGLIGQADNTVIDSCYATGNATAAGTSSVYAGGLVGSVDVAASLSLYDFPVKNCYATGDASTVIRAESPYLFACTGGLLGDCGLNILEGCVAIGNVSTMGFGEYGHAAAFSYRYYILENGTLFAYNGQTFTVDGTPSENDSEKTVLPCSAADLSSADFYKNSLRFDENVWDLSDLDFESGKLPTLKTTAHAD